jgi:hypothetical protein
LFNFGILSANDDDDDWYGDNDDDDSDLFECIEVNGKFVCKN